MKPGIKRWLFLGYGLLLLASFLYRKANPASDPVTGEGWKGLSLPVIDSGEPVAGKVTTMRFREIGNPEAPALLFLHGTPGASERFDRLVPYLEEDFRLILPDLPGFGHSRDSSLPDFSIDAQARYVEAFLEKEDLRELHLVGHGMGGGVALLLGELAPERIDTLAMLSAIGVQERELLGDYMLNHVLHGMQLTVISLVRELTPHFGWMDRSLLNRNYARSFFDTDQRPLRDLLDRWEKPMTIIHGDRDRFVSPGTAEEHFRIVPQSSLHWIRGGSHHAIIRSADEVAGILRKEFLREDAPVRAGASAERIAEAEKPPEPARLDRTMGHRIGVMSLLAVATFGSEDLACISGGLLASRRVISFATTVGGCLVGIFVGDILLFLLGRWGGNRLRKIPLIARRIDNALVDAGREWVEAHAAKLIIASRFLPGSRLPTYCSMGATGMPLGKFAGWFFLAVVIWTPLLVGLSMLFGETLLPFFEKHERYLFPGFIALIVCGLLFVRCVSALATWKGRRLLLSRWRRIRHWEFWPSWLIYSLLIPTFIRLTLRHRSFTVFTAANPGLDCGGLAVEPKLVSLTALRDSGNIPSYRAVETIEELDAFLAGDNLHYPMVLKPNEGEKGRGVGIVQSREEAEEYFAGVPEGVVIVAQDYVDGEEFGVFYYRFPGEENGEIYAITEKKYLEVIGDGEHSIEELILLDDRAVCMAPFFLRQHRQHLWNVPEKGETVELARIGTHCRGALFLDGERFRTEALAAEMDRISRHFEGFFFGRYDVKVPKPEDLAQGKNITVLELNGVTSEATMMYDPKYPLWKGLSILRRQWALAYSIGVANRERGIRPATFGDIFRNLREYRKQSKFEAPAA